VYHAQFGLTADVPEIGSGSFASFAVARGSHEGFRLVNRSLLGIHSVYVGSHTLRGNLTGENTPNLDPAIMDKSAVFVRIAFNLWS
jgi:hypothetical protein